MNYRVLIVCRDFSAGTLAQSIVVCDTAEDADHVVAAAAERNDELADMGVYAYRLYTIH